MSNTRELVNVSKWQFSNQYLPDLNPSGEAFGKFKAWLISEETKEQSSISLDILVAMRYLVDQKEGVKPICQECGKPIVDVIYFGDRKYWHKECSPEIDLEELFQPDKIKESE